MRQLTHWSVVVLLAAFLSLPLHGQSAPSSPSSSDSLHQEFMDPPHDFSPMPFWFWNGKMEGRQIQEQIRDMAAQHVYGAFLHARDGLQTPYLSDEWWNAIAAGLQESKRIGFEFNFVDEYDWPSGEVRNVWQTTNHQSEVLEKRPDFRMKTLAYETQIVQGPRDLNFSLDQDSQAIVAVRWLGKDRIDAKSLTLLPNNSKDGKIHWSVPAGEWSIIQFHLQPAMGFDGGYVDLLNPDAMKLYFQLSYGEYAHRFGSYLGNTIHYSFSDHEGDYGYRIAWTPALFAEFQNRTGYDLRQVLPLLIYDGGNQTTKVRNDYLATITALYKKSFWQGITDSAAKLGIHRTGHAWEESLQWSAALQGSLFAVERGLNPVGVDSLEDFGRQPLNFKVAQSVADFEGRRFMCENQGVQGTNSYLDMEGIRRGTNAIGAWGVNLFVPHAVDYDAGRANYPPDWMHQPYWKYFHYYADYTRRISYMNSDSHHVTNVLLYYPITSIWAHTEPLFSGSADYQQIGKPVSWKNITVMLNDYYTRIILSLADHHWDYNIADDEYLDKATIEGNELVIGPQRFRAVILPPITTLSRKTLAKLLAFHQAGGTIIGIRNLPNSSSENGGDDPVIQKGMAELFDTAHSAESHQESAANTYYIANSVEDLIKALDEHVSKDVRIDSGPQSHIFFEHRQKLSQDYYWVVNDSDSSRTNMVHFSVKGIPEKWDALSGKVEPLFYVNQSSGTDVRLNLAPWDAYYIVFRPLPSALQDINLVASNAETIGIPLHQGNAIGVHITAPASLSRVQVKMESEGKTYAGNVSGGLAPLALNSNWHIHPEPDHIAVPYAKVQEAMLDRGTSLGWENNTFDDSSWSSQWLSPEEGTIRRWKMIGPFPNADNKGFATAYPPEKAFEPSASYEGSNSQTVSWKDYNGNEPYLVLDNWSIWMQTQGGPQSDSAYITQFNPELFTDRDPWIVSYAHTYLYSPKAQSAQFIVAADNWSRIWLNHEEVFQQLRTPFWYEMNDNWADRAPVQLKAGWNEVLVKVGKGRGVASGYYGFSFRVADVQGNTLHDVIANTAPHQELESADDNSEKRWYRVSVPPGCVGVVPPKLAHPFQMLMNGQALKVDGQSSVSIKDLLTAANNTLVIIADRRDSLESPIEFVTGDTPFGLSSLTNTGLANFSGTVIYTTKFSLPSSYQGKRLMLDLGKVSSVADISVNGKPAGTLVWSPYRLDISSLVKTGENTLRIAVTNTEANQRAVGTWHHILPAIDVNGMEGPVSVVPYLDQKISLHPVQ